MKKNLKAICISTLVLTLSGCTSAEKEQESAMNEKIQNEAPANSSESILQRAANMFANAEGLTADQKQKLSTIYTKTYVESMQIRREMGKSKSLLFSTLSKPEYTTSEITFLKKKIVDLDQKRLNLMFTALDDVQAVVGKGKGTEEFYRHFEKYEMPSVNGNY